MREARVHQLFWKSSWSSMLNSFIPNSNDNLFCSSSSNCSNITQILILYFLWGQSQWKWPVLLQLKHLTSHLSLLISIGAPAPGVTPWLGLFVSAGGWILVMKVWGTQEGVLDENLEWELNWDLKILEDIQVWQVYPSIQHMWWEEDLEYKLFWEGLDGCYFGGVESSCQGWWVQHHWNIVWDWQCIHQCLDCPVDNVQVILRSSPLWIDP